jgi:hypothetical protein
MKARLLICCFSFGLVLANFASAHTGTAEVYEAVAREEPKSPKQNPPAPPPSGRNQKEPERRPRLPPHLFM